MSKSIAAPVGLRKQVKPYMFYHQSGVNTSPPLPSENKSGWGKNKCVAEMEILVELTLYASEKGSLKVPDSQWCQNDCFPLSEKYLSAQWLTAFHS